MDGWMTDSMDGWMDECMNGWIDGWMDGWMDEWMDGWMDGSFTAPERRKRSRWSQNNPGGPWCRQNGLLMSYTSSMRSRRMLRVLL